MSNTGLVNRRRAAAAAKPAPKRRKVIGLDDAPPGVPRLLLTREEAAYALHMSLAKVKQLIARGESGIAAPGGIFSMKIGGSRRIPMWAIEAYTRPLAGQEGA